MPSYGFTSGFKKYFRLARHRPALEIADNKLLYNESVIYLAIAHRQPVPFAECEGCLVRMSSKTPCHNMPSLGDTLGLRRTFQRTISLWLVVRNDIQKCYRKCRREVCCVCVCVCMCLCVCEGAGGSAQPRYPLGETL